MKKVVYGAAGLFIAVFAIVWLYICLKTIGYDATEEKPRYDVTQGMATLAGFLATSVATGTAAVLGITIQQIKNEDNSITAFGAGKSKLSAASWLAAGCWTYIAVGLVVLLTWAFKNDKAPEVISGFALSVIGWMAGAFTAAFKTKSD